MATDLDEKLIHGEILGLARECIFKTLGEYLIEKNPDYRKRHERFLEKNWEALENLNEKYPDSKHLKEQIKEIKNTAKGKLPSEVYERIYEDK